MNISSYTHEAAWFNYIELQKRNQLKLNRYLSECLIFSEDTSDYTKYKRLMALDEAVGEKISRAWDAVMNFIRRMWGKFTNNVARLVSSQTSYLEKYKDIILNKKPKFNNVKMYPCAAGIQNIIKNPIKPIEYNALIDNDVMDNVTKNDQAGTTAKNQMITKYLLPDWKNGAAGGDQEQNFLQWATAYFSHGNGSEQQVNATDINLHDMYNFCHDLKNMQDVVEKDYNETEKMSDDFGKKIEDLNKKAQQSRAQDDKAKKELSKDQTKVQDASKPKEGGSGTPSDSSGVTRQYNQKTGGIETVTKASYEFPNDGSVAIIEGTYSMLYGKYLTEVKINNATTDRPENRVSAATQQSGQAARQDAKVRNDKASDDDLAGIKDANAKVQAYLSAAKDMLAAKLSAISFINHEYMQILNYHIKSYVGTPEAKDNSNNQNTPASNYEGNKPQEQQPAQESANILNEGWGKMAALFLTGNLGMAIHGVLSYKNFNSIKSNPKFRKIINSCADKAVAEAKRNNKALTEKIPSSYGDLNKYFKSMDVSDILAGWGTGDYELAKFKYQMFFSFDYDSLRKVYVLMYDKENDKLRRILVNAPSDFNEYK